MASIINGAKRSYLTVRYCSSIGAGATISGKIASTC